MCHTFDNAISALPTFRSANVEVCTGNALNNTLTGNDGNNGAAGPNGLSVELRTSGGFIQWRQTGGSWSNLVALADITGAKGDTGAKGKTGDTVIVVPERR